MQRTMLKRRKQEEEKKRKRRIRLYKEIGFLFIGFVVFLLGIYLSFSNGYEEAHNRRIEQNRIERKVNLIIKKEKKEEESKEKIKREEKKSIQNESVPQWYYSNIPMPKEHQQYLYEMCKLRGLDYKKTLALIQHESVFEANRISETNDYGYFQINKINHEYLSKRLNTPNKPLDPYVNINWGTFLLSELYHYWKERGLKGRELDIYVWSSYNKGIRGFKEYGIAYNYVYSINNNLKNIIDKNEKM